MVTVTHEIDYKHIIAEGLTKGQICVAAWKNPSYGKILTFCTIYSSGGKTALKYVSI